MGECASRPSDQEIQEHMAELNSKNDQFFRYAPFHTVSNDQIITENNLHVLENKRNLFKKKKIEYVSKLESTNHGLAVIPELNIEIQKGVNFVESGYCFTQGKPIVVISLEPNGPKLETFESNIFRPYWYKFIQFKQTIPYTKLLFRVMIKKGYSSDVCLGAYEIKICYISDQMVKEGWFNLDSSLNNKNPPALRLRVQYIYDEKLLLQNIIDYCENKMELVSLTIQKIYDASHNSS